VNVVVFRVAASIASLNTALMDVFLGAPVEGAVDRTRGTAFRPVGLSPLQAAANVTTEARKSDECLKRRTPAERLSVVGGADIDSNIWRLRLPTVPYLLVFD
jgi:hypothetical protein